MPERALILAPRGRDAVLAQSILAEASIASEITASFGALIERLGSEAAFAVVTEEAVEDVDPVSLVRWRQAQPEWSDFPFILLTKRGGVERNPAAARYVELLGNVTFVERPFHPTTLVALAKAALRGRRKQYEARARLEALHRSEERFRAAVEAVQGVLWTNTAEGRMEGQQPAWSSLTGQSFEDYEGFGWSAAVHPDDAQPTIDAWNLAVAQKSLFTFEHRVRRYDRAWRSFSVRAIPIFTTDGVLREWVGVHTDITDRRADEAALRDLNANLEQRVAAAIAERKVFADIFETTDSLVQVVDTNFRWLAINRAASDAFDRTRGKVPVVGTSILEFFADWDDELPLIRSNWQRALNGEEFTESRVSDDPELGQRTYEMKFNALRDADGTQIGAFQVATDVTQRIEDARHLAEALDALRQSQKMEAIGQLTGGVAHDFNNLLTIIRGGAEFLKRPNVTPERARPIIDGIYDAADRAANLTEQLLAFSRRQPLRPLVFDVAERVTATAEMLRSITGARITLNVECEPGLRVNADLAQFETALVNLCVNARDAMHGEGQIMIRSQAAGDQVLVSVTDEGEGIDPAIVPRLFEPFFTTKPVGEGTGLGLSQVYGFARQSGGDVQVRSTPEAGTVFTISLPLTALAVTQPTVIADRSGAGPRRILVVEDNDELRGFASTLLTEMGHVVDAAGSADEALAALSTKADDYDVLFTDVVMVGMSGLDLARHVRKAWPDIDVVLTSGYSDALANADGLEFPLIRKPYSSAELAAVF